MKSPTPTPQSIEGGEKKKCCENISGDGNLHWRDCPIYGEDRKETCDGHNWEIGQVRPEWNSGMVTSLGYREIALVVCTFCGIVRKTEIKNL